MGDAVRIRILLGLVMLHVSAHAEDRLSLQLTGGYTELNGMVPFDMVLTPFTIGGVDAPPRYDRAPLYFETEDESWEALLSYRIHEHFDLQAGYTDIGSFTSELTLNPLPPAGVLFQPRVPLPLNPIFLPGDVIGIPYSGSPATLEAEAWLAGLRVRAPLTEAARVYARLGLLQAAFDATSRVANRSVDDPDDETGWYWGAGIQYRLFSRLQVGMGYAQYDVQITRFDSYQLSVEFGLL